MMRIAICDDDMNCINLIEEYINEFKKNGMECDAYPSGEELVRAYRDNAERYDVILLDMEMEQLNGIETANHIREIDEHVIIVFITSHTEYMRESFRCAPFRFLVKPVDKEEFRMVFRDIEKKLSKQRKVFTFTENKTRIRLYCDDILYCESRDHWILIHTKDTTYRICKSLSDLQAQLDQESFFRVHKSYIVNFRHLKSIKEHDIRLYHCDETIPISRTYKKDVLMAYTNFIERDFYI